MSGRIGHDEFSPVRGEKAIGNIDGNALLALSRQAVHQKRQVQIIALRSDFLGINFERGELILEDHFGFIEQTPDERALAVVHAAAGHEPQQTLVLVGLKILFDVPGNEIRFVGH